MIHQKENLRSRQIQCFISKNTTFAKSKTHWRYLKKYLENTTSNSISMIQSEVIVALLSLELGFQFVNSKAG